MAVRAPLSRPGTVVAGVLAPLSVGGTISFPGADSEGDLAVATDGVDAPEPTVIDPAEVVLP